MKKIFITGSKQCGTNFLLLLFTLLNFDTGFDKNDCKIIAYDNNTSETELPYDEEHYILKNSLFIHQVNDIKEHCKIKYFIIPFRELLVHKDTIGQMDDVNLYDIYSNKSELVNLVDNDISNRDHIDTDNKNERVEAEIQDSEDMIEFDKIINYRNYIVNVITNLQQDKIPTLYLDYEGMMNNPEYLYLRLNPILSEKNIKFNQFLKAYYRCCYHFKSKPDWYDWSMKWISSFY
jgi:hypothetical protein